MKKFIKFLSGLIGLVVLVVALMAVFNICPPQGPWPMPPWCPGPEVAPPLSEAPEEDGAAEEEALSQEETLPQDEMSENERLARVAIGLVQDLTTVNTYFNEGASSMGEVGAVIWDGSQFVLDSCPGKAAAPSLTGPSPFQIRRGPPAGFTSPLGGSGYIRAPGDACPLGASPSASFLNGDGDKITPDLMEEKGIEVISYEELTGGDIDGRQLESTLTSLITPGDTALATADGWNTKVWDQIATKQEPASSLMDYHLWTVSSQIEEVIVDSMRSRMEGMGLPAQILNAFDNSRNSGWYAGPPATEGDLLAAMEIEAVFTGKTEGTIYEQRDFSIPVLGEMPQFGPMSGEGSVVYHDPDSGDYPFDLDIEWTEWDELGRVTAGEIVFDDQEHGVVIEMEIRTDGSRTAHLFREGEVVGVVEVDTNGMITYQDLTE